MSGEARTYIQHGRPSAGYSEVDTSRASEPGRAANTSLVKGVLTAAGYDGATTHEVVAATGISQSSVGSCLSNLHGKGELARLAEVRGGAKVYVLAEYTFGRDTEERVKHGRKSCPHCGGAL